MKFKTIRATCAAAALTGVLCTLAIAPAQAATPVSWESSALGLPAAQELSQGAGVTVAVLDSGVVADHPALKGHVTSGPDYRKDGLEEGDPDWGYHGTAMASDVLKVAPKARILAVRVLSDKDNEKDAAKRIKELNGKPSPVAQGIRYAVDHGADIISMSLGSADGFVNYSDEDTQAVAYALRHGVTLLASAGNSGGKLNDISYPAGYAGVIAVAATQRGGTRADFSTVHTYNDVAAPGVAIMSAKNTGGYATIDGTSPACALAAGVVALMHAKNPKLTPAQANDVLIATTHRPAGGGSAVLGYGPINAAAAVKAAASPPKDMAGAVAYKGKEHLGTPDGTPKTKDAPLEQSLWMTGLVAAGLGLAFLLGGVLLALSGRRKISAGAVGMVQPEGSFPG
ncbi:type VII secretion-associated serine protease mycosin [Streptomyces coacervatus]|uniref:Type VII secretion-associated serine protease mycosin n=1 Tax=Streptomyces coacervatus TaxID=647381 RepID=A0ABP7IJC8_9ACTN|nr:S8 family serine peptidase [Streptomyces coacervatus]MDF2269974.1 S8 family serine peptidase [Streptomyces coacervatus]